MTIEISEQRTKGGYEITFFTDNKLLLREARILLDELSSNMIWANLLGQREEKK